MKRFIGIIFFLGALAFSAVAQEIVVRVAPPHAIHERRERSPAGLRLGFRYTVGWPRLRLEWRQDGNNHHGPMPTGKRIAGFTVMTAGFWWRAAGARRVDTAQQNKSCMASPCQPKTRPSSSATE